MQQRRPGLLYTTGQVAWLQAHQRQPCAAVQEECSAWTCGEQNMPDQDLAQGGIFILRAMRKLHEFKIARAFSYIFGEDISQSASHARANVDSGGTEDQHHTSGHIFTGMIANPFNYCQCATIADRKALTRPAGNV